MSGAAVGAWGRRPPSAGRPFKRRAAREERVVWTRVASAGLGLNLGVVGPNPDPWKK
jgi:hypothetical protein